MERFAVGEHVDAVIDGRTYIVEVLDSTPSTTQEADGVVGSNIIKQDVAAPPARRPGTLTDPIAESNFYIRIVAVPRKAELSANSTHLVIGKTL